MPTFVNVMLRLWVPLVFFAIIGFTITSFYYRKVQNSTVTEDLLKNPFELKSAFLFGAIFAIIIFLTKAAQIYFGDSGIYVASALAGLSSVDAIVVTLSNLVFNVISVTVVERAIVISLIANTVVKIIITIFWGSGDLKKLCVKALGLISIVPLLYLIYLFF